jgi:sortase (surface protein transpeptidase)
MVLLTASGTLTVGDQPAGRPDAPPRAQTYAAAASPERAAAARLVTSTTSPPTTAPPPAAPAVDAQAAIPTRVQVPRVGIDTTVLPLGLDPSGALEAPADTEEAGWFTEGPEPGEQGPAVIAGHLDSLTGPAVFYRVRELVAGDVIVVDRADGSRVEFIVSRIEEHAKAAFPTDAVYGPTAGSELRLITCGGAFNRRTGHYLANVIVFALRAPAP